MAAAQRGGVWLAGVLFVLASLSSSASGQDHDDPAAAATTMTATAAAAAAAAPDPEWETWTAWGGCKRGYVYAKRRECESGACEGDKVRLSEDNFPDSCQQSPQPSFWDDYQSWTACSKSCGNGTRLRVRNCTRPEPNSPPCEGRGHEEQHCNTHKCPVAGAYLAWGEWGECSLTCGAAAQVRTRGCSEPQNDGKPCDDQNTTDTRMCAVLCPGWGAWKEWSECTHSCSNKGTQTRTRDCVQGGETVDNDNCASYDYQMATCNRRIRCPIHGEWGEWGAWKCYHEACTDRLGVQQRTRRCDKVKPRYGGKTCEGKDFARVANCTNPCFRTVHGGWCAWTEPSCKDGKNKSVRFCKCPSPNNGGDKCKVNGKPVDNTEEYKINPTECPEEPGSGSGSGSGDGAGGDDEKEGEEPGSATRDS